MRAERTFRYAGPVALLAILLPLAAAQSNAVQDGFWVAGDLHVHTVYSHDSWDPLHDDEESEPYTLGHSVENQFAIAASRGLDFLVISDHNDIRAHTDPGFGSHGVLGIHAYEKSLGGHAQMLGATHLYDRGDGSAAAINAMADRLRAANGAFQINHPAGGSTNFPDDADWPYAYDIAPDTVEVWNIQSFWQPPAFSSNSIDDALAYWEGWLNTGRRVAATGGSDNHWVSTTAVQGVGQPTTWVYVTELSERGVLDGILAGRTAISWQPPGYGGPRVFLGADTDGDDDTDAMVGDTVPASSSFQVEIQNAPAGSWLQVRTDLGRERVALVAGNVVAPISVPDGARWVWVELVTNDHRDVPAAADACNDEFERETTYCRNQLVRLALTSAMFIGS